MYVPITSEINIEPGMTMRELATEQLFRVAERLKNGAEVSGEDIWKLIPTGMGNAGRSPLVLTRNELAEKYFAQIED